MNEILPAIITVAPDAQGWGKVECEGVIRRCWFSPARFPRPLSTPPVGARLHVTQDAKGALTAIWVIF